MKALILQTFLVAIDDDIAFGGYGLVGPLLGFFHVVLVANLVVFEVDGLIAGVVQFNPGVRKFMDVVQNAFDIRLHDFVDFQCLC